MFIRPIPTGMTSLSVIVDWIAESNVRTSRRLPYNTFVLCAGIYLLPNMRVLMLFGRPGHGCSMTRSELPKGSSPSRDFIEVMGPGTFWWLAIFLKLLGTTWFATRASLMVTSLATAVVTYVLARKLPIRHPAVPVVLIFAASFGHLWPVVSHHGDSNLFALLAFTAFLYGYRRRGPTLMMLAGVLAGCTTCFMQQKGLLLLVAFVALMWFTRRGNPQFLKSMGCLSGGYATVMAIVSFVFWSRGGLTEFLYANYIWPVTRYSGVNNVPYAMGIGSYYWNAWVTPLSSSLSPAVGLPLASLLIVPSLAIAALPALLAVFALCRRSAAFRETTLPYWFAGVALWLSEFHRRDITHLVYGSPLLVILCWHLYSQLSHRFIRRATQVVAACAILLATFNACVVMAANNSAITSRGTVRMFRRDPVLEYLQARVRPGDEIFIYPYSLYVLLSDLHDEPYQVQHSHVSDQYQVSVR